MTTITLDTRELAAVLAGLRLVQRELPRSEFLPQGVQDIFDDGGTIDPLDEGEIDTLCETINCGGETRHAALSAGHYATLTELARWAQTSDSITEAESSLLDHLIENYAPQTESPTSSAIREHIVSDLFDTCRTDDDYLRTLLTETVSGWSDKTTQAYAGEYLNPTRPLAANQ